MPRYKLIQGDERVQSFEDYVQEYVADAYGKFQLKNGELPPLTELPNWDDDVMKQTIQKWE